MTDHMKPPEWFISEGLTAYPDAMRDMEGHVAAMIEGGADERIWLLEHPPLYTAGTSAKAEDLLAANQFPTYDAGRGGQYTYHGPGQRIGYVMLNLKQRAAPEDPDLRAYVKQLEQWIINTLGVFGIKGELREGRVGVWVVEPSGKESKIAALGIRVRKWVSYHGIAINVSPDLSHYSGIVPCGIREHGVTSLQALGVAASMHDVDTALKAQFVRVFG